MARVDPGFGVDDFNRAKVYNETETLKNNILALLFMRPGSYQSIPKLGIGLQDYLYQFFDELDTDALSMQIAAQCQEFIPQIQNGNLKVLKTMDGNTPVLLIVLPTVIEDKATGVAIAVAAKESGLISYNIQFDNSLI